MHDSIEQAFSEAVAAAGGTQTALAKVLGVTPQRVSQVADGLRLGRTVPLGWARVIERDLGVGRARLRPDVWEDDE